jgi:2-polyprenyl-3-methyl-5-hydroxy-6-metoxy-1,4-benzoquinol methylase
MPTIDDIDKINFNIIREGVTEIIREAEDLFDRNDVHILDVAPQDWSGAGEFFNKAKIDTLDIDCNSGATYIADITNCNKDIIPDNFYDVIIMTEVLEHTLNPFNAVNEIHRLLKKGGYLIMTTPFNFRIHGPLPDCWRFSKYGLESLLSNFECIKIEEKGEDRFLCPVQYKTIARK